MARDLYGGSLRIGDGFTSVLSRFNSSIGTANNNISFLNRSINQMTSATGTHRQEMTQLMNNYRQANETIQRTLTSAQRETRNVRDETERTRLSFREMFNNTGIDNFIGKLSKIATGFIAIGTAKKVFSEALDSAKEFQNASVFLESVYGEQQGKEKYKWATNEANKTPFEEGEVASGLARAHSLNLKDDEKSFRMYEDLGSFAKVQGVGGLDSAIDAIADMQSGQWQRLQTITGIKREQLEKFAQDKGLEKFTNKKGQVTNSDAAMNALDAYMKDKGIAGMTEKFANTFEGRMSTLGGNLKKSLSQLMGIAEDGTIKNGSLFQNLSNGLEKVISSINRFSESEGAEKLGTFLGKVGEYVSKFIDFCSDNPDTVLTFVKAIVGFKVASTLLSPIGSLIGLLGRGGLLGSVSELTSGGTSLVNILGSTTSAIARLSPAIAGLGVASLAVMSFLDKNGALHKGFNSFANALMGNSKEKGNIQDYATEAKVGIEQIGLSGINTFAKITGNDTLQRWVNDAWREGNSEVANDSNVLNGVKILSDDEMRESVRSKYKNASDSATKDADYAKAQVGNPDINIHVDKIEKTADVNEVMNEMTRQYTQYTQTNFGY